jgi:DNA-binding MarR family transcriptional regulator
MDTVGYIIRQWEMERPDLDVSPLEVIGRLSRLAAVVQLRLDAVFAQHGLQSWEFDVLSALRRSGEPYELTPGELDRALLITSGTTTHRVSKLEQRGFVARRKDEEDGRVVRVRLTSTGFDAQAAAHVAHAENERRILAGLSHSDIEGLRTGLIALASDLGDSVTHE